MKQFLGKITGGIKRHKFIFAIAVIVLGGSIYFGFKNDTDDTASSRRSSMAMVKKGDISVSVTGTGQVYANSQVDLKGVAAGDGIDITEIAVKNDQEVKEGDLIAVLDTTEPMKNVRNAQLSLQSSLISQKVTNKEYDNETEDDKWQRQTQEITIQQRQLSLSDASSDLEDYYIRAPFDGIVTDLDVAVGDSVSQSDVIASVITKDLYAEISLNEVDVVKVKEGNTVTITFDALPDETITGKVTRVDTIGEISQNVVSYSAEISFDEQLELLKPGMSVSAEISIESKENVLYLSDSAIKTDAEGNHYVNKISRQTNTEADSGENQPGANIIKQIVEVGISDDVNTEIVSGLEEGDVVMTGSVNSSSSSEDTEESDGGPGGGMGIFGGVGGPPGR
jgi:RND family efflux transporter MFP subunit